MGGTLCSVTEPMFPCRPFPLQSEGVGGASAGTRGGSHFVRQMGQEALALPGGFCRNLAPLTSPASHGHAFWGFPAGWSVDTAWPLNPPSHGGYFRTLTSAAQDKQCGKRQGSATRFPRQFLRCCGFAALDHQESFRVETKRSVLFVVSTGFLSRKAYSNTFNTQLDLHLRKC